MEVPAEIASLKECAAHNLPAPSGRIAFAFEVVDRVGEVSRSRAEILWQRNRDGLDRVLMRVSEPAQTAGTALLVAETEGGQPDLFVYLPELSKVKRVRNRRLRGPVLGTDFSFEDLVRLRGDAERTELALLPDEPGPGGPLQVIEARPHPNDRSGYERIVTAVDPERCLPVRIEFFEKGERLRKVLSLPAGEVRRHGSGWLPHRFEMRDLRSETLTRIRIESVDTETALADDLFTRSGLLAASQPDEAP